MLEDLIDPELNLRMLMWHLLLCQLHPVRRRRRRLLPHGDFRRRRRRLGLGRRWMREFTVGTSCLLLLLNGRMMEMVAHPDTRHRHRFHGQSIDCHLQLTVLLLLVFGENTVVDRVDDHGGYRAVHVVVLVVVGTRSRRRGGWHLWSGVIAGGVVAGRRRRRGGCRRGRRRRRVGDLLSVEAHPSGDGRRRRRDGLG